MQVLRESINKIPASRKSTPESRLMEERNAVVSATARMMLERGIAADEREAYSKANEGFVRRYRASQVVVDLGFVDYNLDVPPSCPPA